MIEWSASLVKMWLEQGQDWKDLPRSSRVPLSSHRRQLVLSMSRVPDPERGPGIVVMNCSKVGTPFLGLLFKSYQFSYLCPLSGCGS